MNNQKTREVLAKSLKQGKTPFGESETGNTPHPCLPKVFFYFKIFAVFAVNFWF
jgi:hypothetical protein